MVKSASSNSRSPILRRATISSRNACLLATGRRARLTSTGMGHLLHYSVRDPVHVSGVNEPSIFGSTGGAAVSLRAAIHISAGNVKPRGPDLSGPEEPPALITTRHHELASTLPIGPSGTRRLRIADLSAAIAASMYI